MASIRHIFGITIGLSVIALSVGADSLGFAQEVSQFPYQAQVATDATVRSGIREDDYPTARLSPGTNVRVFGHGPDGWCKIGPPEGSFNLIPASYVELTDSDSGIVKSAEPVPAWVGTRLGNVARPKFQNRLKYGDRVRILGKINWQAEQGPTQTWYQISPPSGERHWIHVSQLQLPTFGNNQAVSQLDAEPVVSAEFNQAMTESPAANSTADDVSKTGFQQDGVHAIEIDDSKFGEATGTGEQVQTDGGLQDIFLSKGDGGFLSNDSLTQPPFQAGPATDSFGSKLYRPNDDFNEGLVIRGNDVAMKIGGYVKLDLIYDFNPIDSTDLFDVGSIPIGAPPRTNSRMHARQSRVNFDTRWKTDAGIVRAFVEGDFFSEGDQFRLRHAYGKLGRFLGGQTWTTFANIDAAPATLDFEGSVSTISPRRAQIRWTQPLFNDQWSLALALEDSSTEIELAPGTTITGEERTISPDFVFRFRKTLPEGNMQFAGIARNLGFQPTGEPVKTAEAWGLNFSQVNKVGPIDRVYWQINYGDGIASLVGGLPDITPTGPDTAALLGYFGWMVGATHNWNDKLASNLTFAESHFQNTSGQPSTDINNLTYLAANLIWSPLDRVDVGIEYLYGKREDISGASGLANRIQFSIFYYLP